MLTYLRLMMELFEVRVGNDRRQGGATLIEYALIIAAIAVAVLVGGLLLTGELRTFFNTDVVNALDTAGGGGT